ncbi:MAG: hypothetical protein QF685_12035, partial [Verrucomicrobiota bacterium]|nr:hypothetical protein [Verrucomicrobiota bacterium]
MKRFYKIWALITVAVIPVLILLLIQSGADNKPGPEETAKVRLDRLHAAGLPGGREAATSIPQSPANHRNPSKPPSQWVIKVKPPKRNNPETKPPPIANRERKSERPRPPQVAPRIPENSVYVGRHPAHPTRVMARLAP